MSLGHLQDSLPSTDAGEKRACTEQLLLELANSIEIKRTDRQAEKSIEIKREPLSLATGQACTPRVACEETQLGKIFHSSYVWNLQGALCPLVLPQTGENEKIFLLF
jgi:hypothetical protein